MKDSVDIFEVRFAYSRCEILFQEWVGLELNIVPTRVKLHEVDEYFYLSSYNLRGVPIEVSPLDWGSPTTISVAPVRHLVMDQRSSLHSSSKNSPAAWLKNMVIPDRRCTKTASVHRHLGSVVGEFC